MDCSSVPGRYWMCVVATNDLKPGIGVVRAAMAAEQPDQELSLAAFDNSLVTPHPGREAVVGQGGKSSRFTGGDRPEDNDQPPIVRITLQMPVAGQGQRQFARR
ncbi:MAG: hypothetical protein ABR497_08945 [Kiritimatiellia bacterium]